MDVGVEGGMEVGVNELGGYIGACQAKPGCRDDGWLSGEAR